LWQGQLIPEWESRSGCVAMKPIDAVTGVRRSADVAKVVDSRSRQTQLAIQSQAVTFARKMSSKSKSVSEIPRSEEPRVDTNLQDRGQKKHGKFSDERNQKEKTEEKVHLTTHPTKGKILDIRGA